MAMRNIEISIGNRCLRIKAEERDGHIWFHFRGRIFVIDRNEVNNTFSSHEKPEVLDEKRILSPMPGQIVKVCVTSEMKVKENQTLVILSSMKMEYTIKSPIEAMVKQVKIKQGEQVTAHQELILFKD